MAGSRSIHGCAGALGSLADASAATLGADLQQGVPGIGIARWCTGSISSRDRRLARSSVYIRIYIFRGTGRICSGDVPHFLGRCYGLALTHAPGDIFHVLHEAVETRTAERNLAAGAIENSRRQRAFERQHRKHAFLDGAFGYEIDDPHRPFLTHAMNACDALFEDRRFHGKSMFTRVEACCRLSPVLPASVDRNTRQAGSSRNSSTNAGRFSDGTPPWKLT